jgi:hypothetical protein
MFLGAEIIKKNNEEEEILEFKKILIKQKFYSTLRFITLLYASLRFFTL